MRILEKQLQNFQPILPIPCPAEHVLPSPSYVDIHSGVPVDTQIAVAMIFMLWPRIEIAFHFAWCEKGVSGGMHSGKM